MMFVRASAGVKGCSHDKVATDLEIRCPKDPPLDFQNRQE
jgi:hypothetical protein